MANATSSLKDKIVIERIAQRGTFNDWKELIAFYAMGQILETISWSKQLDKRDIDFAKLFLQSDILIPHAA